MPCCDYFDARCWIKADTLPPMIQAEFTNAWGESAKGKVGASPLENLGDLLKVMADLSLGIKGGHGDKEMCDALSALRMKSGEKPLKKSLSAAETWISIEDDDEVRTALRLDLWDELIGEGERESVGGTGELEVGVSGEEDDELPDGMGASGEAAILPPPSYTDVAENFGALEDAASASGMHDVLFYLRKAKLAWMRASSKTGLTTLC